MQESDRLRFFVRRSAGRWTFGRESRPTSAFESFDTKERALEVAYKVMAGHVDAELVIDDEEPKRRAHAGS